MPFFGWSGRGRSLLRKDGERLIFPNMEPANSGFQVWGTFLEPRVPPSKLRRISNQLATTGEPVDLKRVAGLSVFRPASYLNRSETFPKPRVGSLSLPRPTSFAREDSSAYQRVQDCHLAARVPMEHGLS